MTGHPVLLALILVSITPALCQQPSSARVRIQVIDQGDASIPNAQIEVRNSRDETILLTKADAAGKADVELPSGDYRLVVSYPAFCPYKSSAHLQSESALSIQAVLKVDTCPGPCQAACIEVTPTHPVSPVLKIVVVDPPGGFIPDAVIQIRSDLDVLLAEARTDQHGLAELTLAQARYRIHVGASGFESWTSPVNLTSGSDQTLRAELRLANTCSPCLTVSAPEEIPFQHYAPVVELPTLPLESITLRANRLRFSHFQHRIG